MIARRLKHAQISTCISIRTDVIIELQMGMDRASPFRTPNPVQNSPAND